MNEKLKYAPGKPGFGSKGDKGIDGNQGLSMYFTDFIPATQSALINSRIAGNLRLWAIDTSVSSELPDGRTYMTGDIFFDKEGKAYEIDASTNTFIYKFASFNMGGVFVPLGVSTDEGHARFFNSNTAPKRVVDNIYASAGPIDYTQVPTDIYSISPLNFTRIEFTDVNHDTATGGIKAFTVYSAGESTPADDNKALAIVYDDASLLFRIGNLDNAGNLRNVNLTFDVSTLKVTKDAGNSFNLATPLGTVLTNYEIAANSLFDPLFNQDPITFDTTIDATLGVATIKWTLQSFTNDPTVTADLYFYKSFTKFDGETVSYTGDEARPLVFGNLDVSGLITITGLTDPLTTAYACYIKLTKNGWTRKSIVKDIFAGEVVITPPGVEVGISSVLDQTFDISANAIWRYEIVANPSSFMYDITCVSTNGKDGTITVSVLDNDNPRRMGIIKVIPKGGAGEDASIWQASNWTTINVDVSLNGAESTIIYPSMTKVYTIKFDPTLPATPGVVANLSLKWGASGSKSSINGEVIQSANITISAPGKTPVSLPVPCNNSNDRTSALWNPYGLGGEIPLEMTNITSANYPITVTIESTTNLYGHVESGDTAETYAYFTDLIFTPVSGNKLDFSYNIHNGMVNSIDVTN